MTTNIYKFEQGRLLVHEERTVEHNYPVGSGVAIRIGHIREIEEVLSVTTDYERYGLITTLDEVRTSGSEIFVVMRRGDMGVAVYSGLWSGAVGLSGMAAFGYLSGITSGLDWLGELGSGNPTVSNITVTANVIGY